MNKAKSKDLRYICRIEQGNYKTWWVRLAERTEYYTQKSFADNLYGSKSKSLKAAQKFRDKEQRRIYKEFGMVMPRTRNRHYGRGVHHCTDNRRVPPLKYWRATFWCGLSNKQLTKQFSVDKYGAELAESLAEQWRHLKVTGEINEIK